MADRSIAAGAGSAMLRGARWSGRLLRGEVVKRVGGPARARVILLFGAVLGLNSADTATIGAVAPQLEHSLHIGNTDIGLLSSVALLIGAVFTIPVGLLVDRTRRIPLLSISIVLWSLASLFSAFASSYGSLLLSRLALGAVTATAGPAIASLIGDYFPSRERASAYAYILGGEIAGTAAGFIVSGTVASVISWRAAFVLLAIPGFFLARSLWITVPEPLRGGQSRLAPGVADLDEALATAAARRPEGDEPPLPSNRMSLPAAVRYVFSIPTNVHMIISSALGYFFFSGLTTFALLFVRGHYHVSQVTAELIEGLLVIGALTGSLASGRISDMLLKRGVESARVLIPSFCYVGAAALLIPGIVSTHVTPAVWFDVGGAALLSAANPPLDAARLDIVPAGLWGRAESIRTVVRSIAQALAPVTFGGVADLVAGIVPQQTPIGTHTGFVSSSTATGLEVSFLIMLVSLVGAGVFLARARNTYPRDVAIAAASNQGTAQPQGSA